MLLAAVAALHVACWVGHPTDTDPLNFYAALTDYDVEHDRPHPPGYPLFVAMGRLLAAWVVAAHAFQAVGLLLLVAAGGFLYAALAARGLRWVGLGAAVLLVSHPLAWSATLAGESYMADATFACAIFWVTRIGAGFGDSAIADRAPMRSSRGRSAVMSTGLFVVMLLLGLFRPVSVVLLAPLALACIWSDQGGGARRVRLAAGLLAVVAAFIVAYAITVTAAGGWPIYRDASSRVMAASFRSVSVLGGAPAAVHAQMLAKLLGWAIALASPALLVWGVLVLRDRRSLSVPLSALRLWPALLAWVLPALCFYAGVYYLKPTYHLIYLPAFLVAFSMGVARLARRRACVGVAVVTGLAALQFTFFFSNAQWPQPLERQTYSYLRRQDDASARLVSFLNGVPPSARVLWAGHGELNVYSLRLAPHLGPVAVYDASRPMLQTLEPGRMVWSRPTERIDSLPAASALYVVRAAQAGTSLDVVAFREPQVLDLPLVRAVLAALNDEPVQRNLPRPK